MTKKEFLESRGYVCVKERDSFSFNKTFNKAYVSIYPTALCFEVYSLGAIRKQQDIDNLQICFNNVKRDFEEVMKLED